MPQKCIVFWTCPVRSTYNTCKKNPLGYPVKYRKEEMLWKDEVTGWLRNNKNSTNTFAATTIYYLQKIRYRQKSDRSSETFSA